LGLAASAGHLHVWSRHSGEEAVLAETSYAGVLPGPDVPFVEAVVNNTSGARLDTFLHRSLSYYAGPCHGATRSSTVTFRLDSAVPAAPAKFLLKHTDHPPAHTPANQLRLSVSIYTTSGSMLQSALLDGQPVTLRQESSDGHEVFGTDVAVDRNTSRVLVLQLTEPRLRASPVVAVQPLAQPQQTTVNANVCQ
jgi:hypothetical protein